MAKMKFSIEQQSQVRQILIEDRQQIDAVFTKEQQQKTIANQSRDQVVNQGWKKLNLTPQQKARIKAIRDQKKQELNEILTPEQQAKIKSGKGKVGE